MALDPLTAVLNIGNTVLDRILPDKTANDAAKAQLLAMQLKGEIDVQLAQIGVNQQEAASSNWWVAGWRPYIGWACGTAFIYAAILQPFIQFVAVLLHSSFDMSKLPHLDSSTTNDLLLALLGFGAMRSYDKQNGNGNGH